MKAWSRAQHQHERDLGLYHQHQAEADLISSYLSSQQQYLQQQHHSHGGRDPAPYGVPIPPPLVPSGLDDDEVSPQPPPRSSSSTQQGGGGSGQRSRGKRSRHSGTTASSSHHENPATTSRSAHPKDIHYPKYDLYGDYPTSGKYSSRAERDVGVVDQCQYATKYGEDCHKYVSSSGGKECRTWPKQQYVEEASHPYTQDDHSVQYLHELEENARLIQQQQQEHAVAKYAQVNKQRKQQQQQADRHYYEQQQQQQPSRQQQQRERSPLQDLPEPRSYTQEQLQAARQAQEVVQCTKLPDADHKYLEATSAESKERASAARQQQQPPQPPPQPQQSVKDVVVSQQQLEALPPPAEQLAESAGGEASGGGLQMMETFRPQVSATRSEVQLQQEQIQYDNDCCQVVVTTASDMPHQPPPPLQQQQTGQGQDQQLMSTATLKRSKGKMAGSASQFNTLERNMAEVAERNRHSEQQLGGAGGVGASSTMERTLDRQSRNYNSCDTCDAPLTPASLAGIDHRDLEHRPLTRSVTRATMYDEPPEKSSLFIVCSGLYGILLVIICLAFLSAEVVTHSIPLHYFEGFFTYLYITAILFLLYVFCYLLHEASCCGSGPPAPGTVGRNTYFHLYRYGVYTVNTHLTDSSKDIRRTSLDSWNLPRDALPDGSPVREKLATLRRPKKYKTSENDFSHGSFFLRVGGIAFGLGAMIYNGMELGSFFEIPWNSPCYQVLRGINPILQMVFTFSQMYFVFMNARLNIHRFKFLSRFGLTHVVATNLCVWIRTLVKECNKEVAMYRSELGHGVSEDYMILEGYNSLRRKFGPDSFWVNGPYHAIMSALTPPDYAGGSPFDNLFGGGADVGPAGPDYMGTPPTVNALQAQALIAPANEPLRRATASPFDNLVGVMSGGGAGQMQRGSSFYAPADENLYRSGVIHLAHNFSCGRTAIMGEIVRHTSPYLFPFVIEYSFIAAAVLIAMWKNIGKNPRFWGEEDDHVSVASRKMTNYAKTDCIGASKGLFFGLLTLICGLICLILFFVLIDHNNKQVSQLAVFLADSSHCVILIVSILATLLGFLRVQKLKFHGEDQSVLGNSLLLLSACGIFAYSAFNVIAGGLGVHTDMKNILVLGTGAITILQVLLQLLFITDAQRRRVSTSNQNTSKPGRQVVTFLLICNLTMWIIYTFEVQKVDDSPVQLNFFGFYAWTVIQRVTLPLCIFFRFHSTVILAEIWKNSYKTKLCD